MKDQDEDPIDLAEELTPKDGVRVFRAPVDRLVALAKAEILRGMENQNPVPAELLPLLGLCNVLPVEAFDLVLIPKQDCPAKQWPLRRQALGLCHRWYTARFHLRLRNCPLLLIFPHAEGWQA